MLKEIDFDKLTERGTAAEVAYAAFIQFEDKTQVEIETECPTIESMAHQAGVTALI